SGLAHEHHRPRPYRGAGYVTQPINTPANGRKVDLAHRSPIKWHESGGHHHADREVPIPDDGIDGTVKGIKLALRLVQQVRQRDAAFDQLLKSEQLVDFAPRRARQPPQLLTVGVI